MGACEHDWEEVRPADPAHLPHVKCSKCAAVKSIEERNSPALEEYKLIHEKINVLDRITFEIRIAFIGGLSFLAGVAGLLPADTLPRTIVIWDKIVPIQIVLASIGLIIVISAAGFDIHYRSFLYKIEERGKDLEEILNFCFIRKYNRGDERAWGKWSFLVFYLGLLIFLIVIIASSVPLIVDYKPSAS